MTDKEKIRAEIERLKESGCASPIVICDTLLAFIDSMQEKPVTDDLEEAARKYEENRNDLDARSDNEVVRRAFVAGANWQKHQMMKDAIEGYVDMLEFPDKTWIELSAIPKDLKDGDKVKLTIIKED